MTQDDLHQIQKLLVSINARLEGLEKKIETEREHTQRMFETEREHTRRMIEATEHSLKSAIKESQEDTINVLSDLINTGFNAHEERIRLVSLLSQDCYQTGFAV